MNTMHRLTRDDVINAVGEIDDVTIAEIIATGATADELAEAQAWLVNDKPLLNAGKRRAGGRVGDRLIFLARAERAHTVSTKARWCSGCFFFLFFILVRFCVGLFVFLLGVSGLFSLPCR